MLHQRFPAGSYGLIPRGEWRPYPDVTRRAEWEAAPRHAADPFQQRAEAALDSEWPALPATLYLDYARTGNRSRFESAYFGRRAMLSAFVLAECLEDRSRFLDRIVEGIWLVCEESSWCIPAHIAAQRAGPGFPDTTEPIVDLFAAETGAALAWSVYLLEPRLSRISPLLVPRIHREVKARIIDPFLLRDDFWWMGLDASAGRPNNWNPWVCSNVLCAGCLLEDDTGRRASVVEKVMRCLDRYLDPHPRDGGCDEGPEYWSRAAGSVFDCLDTLESVSAGAVAVWREPLVREMARYILRAHIDSDWYVNFADAPAIVHPPAGVVFGLGVKLGNEELARFGSWLNRRPRDADTSGQVSPQRALREIFLVRHMAAVPPAEAFPRHTWLPDVQVMVSRDEAGTAKGFLVAAKGGNNNESHNHNDIGSLVIYRDGLPLVVDAGVGVYTRATFRPEERYGIWTMQSAYHSLLPTLDGVMQAPGARFAAREIVCTASEEARALSMDIAGAYPESAGIDRWSRRIELRAGAGVTVCDEYALRRQVREIVLSFLTPCRPRTGEAGTIRLIPGQLPGGLRTAGGTVGVEAPSPFHIRVEKVGLNDQQLRAVWGPRLSRVVITLADPPVSGALRFSVRAR
jgi:hypothetical protein